MHRIDFRPATADDFAFFFQLHKDTLGPYVDQVWGWDDEDQRAHLRRTIDYDATQVIVADEVEIGRLKVERRQHEVYLGLIEIAPSHQGRGIGGHIVRGVLDDAFADGKRCASTCYESTPPPTGCTAASGSPRRRHRRSGLAMVGAAACQSRAATSSGMSVSVSSRTSSTLSPG